MLLDFSKIRDFLFFWQSLAGAFLGAFVPIVFSLILYWFKSRNEFKRNLGQLEKFLVYSINDLFELRQDLELFIKRLDDLIYDIGLQSENVYYLGVTNFPLYKMEYDVSFLNKKTKSIYLANKLMKSYSLFKEINLTLADLKEEFRLLTDRNYNMVLSYKDPGQRVGISTKDQRGLYLQQLRGMKKVIEETILDKNIPIAIRSFLGARIILLKYIKNGMVGRIYFEGIGGYISKKENGQELVENKFKGELERNFEKFEKIYKERFK